MYERKGCWVNLIMLVVDQHNTGVLPEASTEAVARIPIDSNKTNTHTGNDTSFQSTRDPVAAEALIAVDSRDSARCARTT